MKVVGIVRCGLELVIKIQDFFHTMANFFREFDSMSSVILDGNRFENFEEMKFSIHGF